MGVIMMSLRQSVRRCLTVRTGLHLPVAPPVFRTQLQTFSTHSVTFMSHDGDVMLRIPAPIGKSILELAHDNGIDMEGACGGECACSTCHVILQQDDFNALPEPDDDEMDMLDLAEHVTETSRLGCQISLPLSITGDLAVRLPEGTTNMLG